MPAKRNARTQMPLVVDGVVSAWEADVDVRADSISTSIVIQGKFSEPLKGGIDFRLHFFNLIEPPGDVADASENRSSRVGTITRIKPEVSGMVFMDHIAMQNLLTLASTNRLADLFLCVDEPWRGRAEIHGVTFRSGPVVLTSHPLSEPRA